MLLQNGLQTYFDVLNFRSLNNFSSYGHLYSLATLAPELEQPVMQNIHHLLLPQEQDCCHSSICIALLAINITPSTKKKWLKLRQHVDAPLYSKFAMELRQ